MSESEKTTSNEQRLPADPTHLRAATAQLERLQALCGDLWGPSTRAYWQSVTERADRVQGAALHALMENLADAVQSRLAESGTADLQAMIERDAS